MRLAAYSTAFLIALLLAGTTPVGTGAGSHQFDLLHPLFSHVHLVNGRVLTHEELAEQTTPTPPGVALGSTGADDAFGVGLSPVVPLGFALTLTDHPLRWTILPDGRPVGREEPPPVPPPL